jgi:hypothetical protein
MKRDQMVRLSVLIMGFAIAPGSLMAQGTSASAAADPQSAPPSADTGAFQGTQSPPYPSAVLVYTRPTEEQKLQQFAYDAFGPVSVAEAALGGGIQQETKTPPEWGSSWDGFGKRVASNFGVDLATTITHYGVAEIVREDPAYYACQCRGILPRLRHAVISTFTGRRGADGHTVFSFAALGSPYAGSMTALLWYPDRYGWKDGLRMGNYNLASQAGGNLWLEFIYGGPHTLLGKLRHHKAADETAVAQRP